MDYSKQFTAGLKTGQTMVRRIWLNTNSEKGQYSVQFMQRVINPAAESAGAVVALFQGYEEGQLVTAIGSISPEVIKSKGIDKLLVNDEAEFYSGEKVFTAKQLFGTALDIQVLENTTKNKFSSTQEPKMNPATGEILTKDGEPIYRHTSLVLAGASEHSFMKHDTDDVVNTSRVAEGIENEMAGEV